MNSISQSPFAGGHEFRIVRTVPDLRECVRAWRSEGLSVGLVPTMGALHQGHLHLVHEARRRTERVITSVFVNPTQFSPTEDLAAYPRKEAIDAELLEQNQCSVMFAPTVADMYAPGSVTRITVGDAEIGGPSQGLEGAFRPQMFAGVALVVAKLLNQAQADVAVFGEKDWQQLQVIKRMVLDLDIPTDIISMPTVRDTHGLALSSRNAYLSEAELEVARHLNRILEKAAASAASGHAPAAVEAEATASILNAGFNSVDYVAIRKSDDLSVFTDGVVEGPARILAAARIGTTRLIDNMAI